LEQFLKYHFFFPVMQS